MCRVESVAYADVYPLLHRRLHGRGVEHLRPVLGQLQRGLVGYVGNGLRRRHELGVGGHDSGHIGPDFQSVGPGSGGIEGRTVVGTSPAERRDPAVLVGGDEPGGDEQPDLGLGAHGGRHGGIAGTLFHFGPAGPHQLARIKPFGTYALAGELPLDYDGRKYLAERLDAIARITADFLEDIEHQPLRVRPLASRKKPADNPQMPLLQFPDKFSPGLRRGLSDFNQGVGASAYRGAHQNHAVPGEGRLHYVHHRGNSRRIRDGTAAELEYLHQILCIFAPRAPSLCSIFS